MNSRRCILLSLALCAIVAFGKSSCVRYYSNPLRTDDRKAIGVGDPYVYRYKGTYYLTGTAAIPDGQGFPCYTSRDLVTWTYRGDLYKKPDRHIGSSAFWAPEVKYYRHKFYMTYSCYVPERHQALTCLAVSDTPDGPFKDLHTPWFDFGYSAIDTDIFIDSDGTPYVYFSRNETVNHVGMGTLYAVRMKRDLSGPDGKPVYISTASQQWEKVNWDRNRCNEGPFVFKRRNKYYMTYSANDTGYGHYGIGVAVADHPLGPWVKDAHNPLMTTDLDKGISSPGHNSIVRAPDGDLYIVYHRHADAFCKKPNWDRVVCMDRLYFDRKGRLRTDGPTSAPQKIRW
ncbi:MAG: glycoside hydrolase family 43 protein [Prevotella sp.]|nr:glycoside hydrolase family 43 protein [Prevotella sp.]MCH4018918.1 glycoside hydrolase family 43 protein [Prevotella sp.]MCH4099473.1 glycoside hydrolase family 43 protein [Prevotella sp.]MCH4216248.1 glycoside hydrolase family 43 protein [Prevotella sp.]MCI1292146.1 glycoside hydrolase family 43 protein [Prevotella sp.]MCI1325023.1 glycoside hydrolase family 43 protein [Prevotella sp.]